MPLLPKSIVTTYLVFCNFKYFWLPRHFINTVFQDSPVFADCFVVWGFSSGLLRDRMKRCCSVKKSSPTDYFVQHCSGKQLHLVAENVGAAINCCEKCLSKQAGISKRTYPSKLCSSAYQCKLLFEFSPPSEWIGEV